MGGLVACLLVLGVSGIVLTAPKARIRTKVCAAATALIAGGFIVAIGHYQFWVN